MSMIVAFDVDNCLLVKDANGVDVPNYGLIAVLMWFNRNGDTVVVWSGGGTDHARHAVDKLGLHGLVTVVPKGSNHGVQLTFDDSREMSLGKLNVLVRSENNVVQ